MKAKDMIAMLQKDYDPECDIVQVFWSEDDIIHKATEMGKVIDKEQIESIVDRLERNADAEYGLCWDTIECAIEEEDLLNA